MKTDERNKFAIKSFLGEYLDLKKDKDNELATVDSIRKGVEFKGANLWILIFAIFMASLGLNVNSTAVIIGAMLISPLMGPIMGVGLSVGLNDFELMKRSLKSFLITTAFSVTTATIFFLLAPIALLQGLVRVDSPRTEENGYLLKPGQTLNVNTDTYQAELIEYNQPTDVLLWMKGKLEFKQHSLLEITNIMEKLYDIKFIYKDDALKSERFTGEFSTDSTADEILNVLMHTNHFSYKKDGRIIRVMKK